MADIDNRLLDSSCQANIDENFNRTLALVAGGGGGGGLVVNIAPPGSENSGHKQAGATKLSIEMVTDKTYNEIKAVLAEGGSVVLCWDENYYTMLRYIRSDGSSYWMEDSVDGIFGAATPDEFLSTDYSA